MTNKKAPSIRFKGFTDDWEQRKLGDCFLPLQNNTLSRADLSDENGVVMNVHYGDVLIKFEECLDVSKERLPFVKKQSVADKFATSYLKNGDVIVADTAEDETVGKCTEIIGLTDQKVISGVHTIPLRPNGQFATGYLGFYMNSAAYHTQLKPLMQGIKVTSISKSAMQDTVIKYPSDVKEQALIGQYFMNLDHLITLHQRECERLQIVKKSMLENMFPKNGERVPKIRFSGFTDDWEQRKLDDLCSLVTKQTGFDYSSTIKPSLVNEHLEGTLPFIQNKDFSGNNINMDTDFYIPEEVVNKYPKITLDQPCLLISISGKIGNVGLYKRSERAFIGGAVGICRLLDDTNGEFIMQELLSDKGQHYFQSLIKASSHQNITVEDIRKIEIPMPSASEQKKISQYFEQLDNLITLHQSKLEKLRLIKKSMLDQMFV